MTRVHFSISRERRTEGLREVDDYSKRHGLPMAIAHGPDYMFEIHGPNHLERAQMLVAGLRDTPGVLVFDL